MHQFIIIIILLSADFLKGHAQDTLKYTAKFNAINRVNDEVIDRLDSVTVIETGSELRRLIKNVPVKDNSFTVPDLGAGRYSLKIQDSRFIFVPMPFTICGKCRNMMNIEALPRSSDITPYINLVEVYPAYIGRWEQLKTDFFSALTPKEKRKFLKQNAAFTVDLFITQNNEIGDIRLRPGTKLSRSFLKILFKGLASLQNWDSAIVNGQRTDGIFSISYADLVRGR